MGRFFDAWGPGIRKFLESLGDTTYSEVVATTLISGPPASGVFKALRNGGGSPDMNLDGSATPSNFDYVVPPGKQVKLKGLRIFILDGNMRNDGFAGIIGGLTNGVLIQIIGADGTTVLLDFLDGLPIMLTADFSRVSTESLQISSTIGDDLLQVVGNTAEFGASLLLTAGQRFRIIVRDDLTSITKMQAAVVGSISDAQAPDP